MSGQLFWVDLETLGLKAQSPVIEVALAVTDYNLNVIDEVSWTVWGGAQESGFAALPEDDWARNTHLLSGLINEAIREGQHLHVVERQAVEWLKERGIEDKAPLCGASVHADRTWMVEQMPDLIGTFGYRNIDVSSFKETCARFNSRMFAFMEDDVILALTNQYDGTSGEADYGHGVAHRGTMDLRWSIFEMRWYQDNFLFVDLPDNE